MGVAFQGRWCRLVVILWRCIYRRKRMIRAAMRAGICPGPPIIGMRPTRMCRVLRIACTSGSRIPSRQTFGWLRSASRQASAVCRHISVDADQCPCENCHIPNRSHQLVQGRAPRCLHTLSQGHVLWQEWWAKSVEEIGREIGADRFLPPRCSEEALLEAESWNKGGMWGWNGWPGLAQHYHKPV